MLQYDIVLRDPTVIYLYPAGRSMSVMNGPLCIMYTFCPTLRTINAGSISVRRRRIFFTTLWFSFLQQVGPAVVAVVAYHRWA